MAAVTLHSATTSIDWATIGVSPTPTPNYDAQWMGYENIDTIFEYSRHHVWLKIIISITFFVFSVVGLYAAMVLPAYFGYAVFRVVRGWRVLVGDFRGRGESEEAAVELDEREKEEVKEQIEGIFRHQREEERRLEKEAEGRQGAERAARTFDQDMASVRVDLAMDVAKIQKRWEKEMEKFEVMWGLSAGNMWREGPAYLKGEIMRRYWYPGRPNAWEWQAVKPVWREDSEDGNEHEDGDGEAKVEGDGDGNKDGDEEVVPNEVSVEL